ncbi:MAG: glycine oxidase ThiO [Acidobacteria bacterium]|nr:glycine oxidase ThiO [Acidobacteriota bacterium]NIM60642.1 glycine oxidase ThiO [Acidobacteriota bacterium]NIO57929.1 glycine oxidase ThiO [Acidobacteriota bacterium]NIQ28932.1 glycine oxidase ThiO [Acidobacteriota bacterium]NIQ83406.1 glycine oxidase ThiO [Acidobacteriota bacterium]
MNGGRSFDVIVVGAGVIGLSIAYELLRRERSVLLIEKERPGAGASSVAGGMLAPVSESEDQPAPLTDLCLLAAREYPVFVGELERVGGRTTRYRDEGTLWVALNRDDQEELARLEAALHERDLAVEKLNAAGIAELEPHLSPRVLGGLRVPGDHQIDPRALLHVLQRAVRALGGRFLCPSRVRRVIAQDGRAVGVLAVDPDGSERALPAEQVVLATGAWTTSEILGKAAPFAVRPVKGQLVRLHGPALIRHVAHTPDVYVIPREDGELLIGATVEEMGFDVSPRAGAVMDLLRHAWELLPGSYDLDFVAVDVGLRPATEDHAPLIGPTDLDGLLLATGHYRNGILLAPVTARAIADWVAGSSIDPRFTPFVPCRIDAVETA